MKTFWLKSRCQIVCLLLAATLLPDAVAEVPQPIQQALQQAGVSQDSLGYAVYSIDGSLVSSHRGQIAMQPASTMKVLTTYAALTQLGPAHTWKTVVRSDGLPANGLLTGNLYLQGGGDPSLVVERFWLLLRQLQQRGVTKISGDVVLDRSNYGLPEYDPAAFDNEPLRAYNAGADALLVNFSAVRVDLWPDLVNRRAKPSLATPTYRLVVDGNINLVDGPCGEWRDKLTINLRTQTGSSMPRIEINGPYAIACGEKTLNLNLNYSSAGSNAQVEDLFRAIWKELGGSLSGQVRAGITPAGSQPLMVWESPPLVEVLRDTNKFSNNVMARQIFLSLADTVPATAEAARRRLLGWLQSKSLHFPELVLDNGSGLSRTEAISASHMAQLLVDAWRNPLMPEFVATLPLAGIDGTLKKRFEKGAANGRAHLKTGSLSGVRALAGYVQDQRGRQYALACFVNDGKAVNAICDALADWVASKR